MIAVLAILTCATRFDVRPPAPETLDQFRFLRTIPQSQPTRYGPDTGLIALTIPPSPSTTQHSWFYSLHVKPDLVLCEVRAALKRNHGWTMDERARDFPKLPSTDSHVVAVLTCRSKHKLIDWVVLVLANNPGSRNPGGPTWMAFRDFRSLMPRSIARWQLGVQQARHADPVKAESRPQRFDNG